MLLITLKLTASAKRNHPEIKWKKFIVISRSAMAETRTGRTTTTTTNQQQRQRQRQRQRWKDRSVVSSPSAGLSRPTSSPNSSRPVLEQDLYHIGLTKTTATFATTMLNLLPVFTFVLAVIFRLEKVKLKEIRSIAKITGTIIAVCGSFVMALYKGPLIGRGELRIGGQTNVASSDNDLVGFILLFLSCIAWAGFTIFQTIVLREYPHELSLAALICFTGTIEGTLVAMVAEHGQSAGWSIGWDWKLLAVVYSVVVTVVTYYVLGTLLKKKGPVFVTAFSPVMTVFTAMTGLFLTGEDLFLGGLIGALLVFLGLFSVLWGKSKNEAGKSRNEVSQRANDGEQGMISCTVNVVDPETQTVVHQDC